MTDGIASGALRAHPSLREPERRFAYFFLLPALALVLVFRMIPLAVGFGYSLTDWDGIAEPSYIGLDNYATLLSRDAVFHDSLVNTAILLATLPIWVGLPLLLAILIHQGVPGGFLYRAVYFLPAVLSAVIVGAIFNIVLHFNGSLNGFLTALGFDAVDWLGSGSTALGSIIAVQIWSSFGMGVLIFLSGLAAVPRDLVDAAKVDGAGLFQTMRYVLIPMLVPIIEFVAVVTVVGMLTSMFGLIYVMTAGGPGTATYLPEFLIWLQQGQLSQPGYAAATSMLLFLLMAGFAFVQIRIMSRNLRF